MSRLLAILLLVPTFAGCASTPRLSSVSTAPVAQSLDKINGDLSQVDGKATVVESWVKQNCR